MFLDRADISSYLPRANSSSQENNFDAFGGWIVTRLINIRARIRCKIGEARKIYLQGKLCNIEKI